MKKFLVIILTIFLSACANTKYVVENPSNKTLVSQKIYEVKSEFGEHRIFGPVIEADYSGLLYNDKVSIQLMKTENNNYYLRVHNFHSGKGWKFIESITTLKKETIELQEVSQETPVCLSKGCSFTEVGFALLDKEKYLRKV